MLNVHISSSTRAAGKTMLAWQIIRYLRSIGHDVVFVGPKYEKDIVDDDSTIRDLVKTGIRTKKITVFTDYT